MAKVWESTTKATSTARTTSTAKTMRKEKKEERKAWEKDKEKTQSQHQIRVSKATAGHVASVVHKASECWQGYVQAVEEVPSSSASSVAPSAATTLAAAKTAASIQEFNDEQEPGWIFGVMGGSVASVTTGTDGLWDELVLDSGSVSTACPYSWPDFTLSFDDYKCYMHKGNQRVEIFRKGGIFVLRMRRRWLESKVQMAAPIDGVAEEEMEIDDDGEGAGGARAEPRADEFGNEPPPPRAREVRPSSIRPGAEAVRLHNLTRCP